MSWIFSHGGVFPVRRGHQDEEAFISAFRILERGGAVVMYCEGGRSRTGKLADEARPGIGRLALESGAPVVPVAILGSYQVRNWKRLPFPEGDRPVRRRRSGSSASPTRTREQQQEAADEIFGRIKTLHAELERRGPSGALQASRRERKTRKGRTMSTTAEIVTGVDFVPVPTRDIEAAAEFYGKTLGLPRAVYYPERNFAEFETGNLTLSLINGEAIGIGHQPQPQRDRAARRRRRGGAGGRSRSGASSSMARPWTPASATWRSSTIPTGTR